MKFCRLAIEIDWISGTILFHIVMYKIRSGVRNILFLQWKTNRKSRVLSNGTNINDPE